LEFGRGTLVITEASTDTLAGTIGGPGWSLSLHGSFGFGSPMQVRFEGRGVVGGEEWIYDYVGWLVPVWPNSNAALQRAAIVGSVVRTPSRGLGGVPRPGASRGLGTAAAWGAPCRSPTTF
ncbi:MAG: hypothetical protein ACREJS_10650, partial [Candidatus Rokuibacteriota bacterium]